MLAHNNPIPSQKLDKVDFHRAIRNYDLRKVEHCLTENPDFISDECLVGSALSYTVLQLHKDSIVKEGKFKSPEDKAALNAWLKGEATAFPKIGEIEFAPMKIFTLLLNTWKDILMAKTNKNEKLPPYPFSKTGSDGKTIRNILFDNLNDIHDRIGRCTAGTYDKDSWSTGLELYRKVTDGCYEDGTPKIKFEHGTVKVKYLFSELRTLLENIEKEYADLKKSEDIELIRAQNNYLVGQFNQMQQNSQVMQQNSQTIAVQYAYVTQALGNVSTAVTPMLNKHLQHEAFDTRKHNVQKSPASGFYAELANHFEAMAICYKNASQDFFKREQLSFFESVGGVMAFVKDHIPAPFNAPFSIISGGIKFFAKKKENKRYEEINKILPMLDKLPSFVQTVGVSLSEALLADERCAHFSEKDMVALSKRAFVVAIHSIYDVDALKKALEMDDHGKIKGKKVTDDERLHLLTEYVINTVWNSPHFSSLLEQKMKATFDVNSIKVAFANSNGVSLTPSYDKARHTANTDYTSQVLGVVAAAAHEVSNCARDALNNVSTAPSISILSKVAAAH